MALVIVLTIIAILTTSAVDLSYNTRVNLHLAANARDELRAYYQARSEIENHINEQGEQALFEANVPSVHPELVKLLGRLRYRTSYGQNVLAHSIEAGAARGAPA